MLLSSQDKSVGQKPTGRYPVRLKTTVAVVTVSFVLIAIDASATVDKVDLMTAGLAALPAETLKVYSGLMKVIPFAAGSAAALAAMRGGMGFVMGLVRSVISG